MHLFRLDVITSSLHCIIKKKWRFDFQPRENKDRGRKRKKMEDQISEPGG